MADNELVININGDASDFNKSIKGIQGNLKKVAVASGAAFIALSAGIGATVKQFAKFDNELTAVKTLLDESSFASKTLDEGFEDLRKGLLAVGSEFPVSIEGLNKALFDTVSAGVDAAQSIEFVATAAKLGVAGLTDVSIATDGLTTATNAFGLGAENAEATAAKFFTAQKFGKTTIEELSGSLGVVAASASAAGVSFEEVLASVSAATLAGVQTNTAFTSLKAVFANVVKPTKDATDEAERLGVQFNSAALRSKGLAQFLNDLTEAEGFNAASAEKLFGSVEALNVIQALTGSQSEKFTEILGELTNETKLATTFNQAFETQNATLSNQFAILQNQVQAIAIELGSVFAPIVSRIVGILGVFIGKLQQNEGAVKALAIALGVGVVGAGLVFAISTLGLLIPALITGLGVLSTAFLAAGGAAGILASATGIGAIAIVVGLVIANLQFLIDFFTGPLFAAFQFIQSIVEGVVQKFISGFSAIKFAVTGELGLAVEAAKIALTPLPVILFNAARDASAAFKEGRAIGLASQKIQNEQTVTEDKSLFQKLVGIFDVGGMELVTTAQTTSAAIQSSGFAKRDALVSIEEDLASQLIAIDVALGDDQVAEFNATTNELIGAAQSRASQVAAASGGGGTTAQVTGGGGGGGTGGEGSTAADAVFGLLLEDSSAGRAARKNLTPFSFNPLTNQNDLLSFIQQILIDRGIKFQRGLSGEGFSAQFSGREIVIPENFAEGIRRGRFALVGGGDRQMLGQATRENVRVDISFRGREATRVLQAQTNQDTRLGTRREIT